MAIGFCSCNVNNIADQQMSGDINNHLTVNVWPVASVPTAEHLIYDNPATMTDFQLHVLSTDGCLTND